VRTVVAVYTQLVTVVAVERLVTQLALAAVTRGEQKKRAMSRPSTSPSRRGSFAHSGKCRSSAWTTNHIRWVQYTTIDGDLFLGLPGCCSC
jgi:hypothetical protein